MSFIEHTKPRVLAILAICFVVGLLVADLVGQYFEQVERPAVRQFGNESAGRVSALD